MCSGCARCVSRMCSLYIQDVLVMCRIRSLSVQDVLIACSGCACLCVQDVLVCVFRMYSCVQNVLFVFSGCTCVFRMCLCVHGVIAVCSGCACVFRMCSLCVQDGLPESDVGPRPLLLQAVVGGHAEHAAVHIRHLLASDPPATRLAARWRSPSARSFLSSLRRTKCGLRGLRPARRGRNKTHVPSAIIIHLSTF